MTQRTSLGALFTVLAMLLFAGGDAIAKWLTADYTVGEIMWIRYGVFCVFAFLVVRRRGLRQALVTRQPFLQAARALVGAIESALFVLAFHYLPLADAHAIAATAPLFVIALGGLLLGERVGLARGLAVLAGFAGVLLIVRPGFRVLDWPLLLPLAGAVLWAVYQMLTRLCARSDTPDTTLVWTGVVSFAAMGFAAPWGWQWPDATAWMLLGATALLSAGAHYALILALDFAEASAIQPYNYSILVWVTVLGALAFGDFPDRWTFAGAAVIVASGLYTWRHDRRAVPAAAA